MVYAEKIEIARVFLVSERRVGEENLPVFPDHDVIGRVELFALVPFGENLHLAPLIQPRHPPRMRFAAIEPALRIEGIAHRAIGILTQNRRLLAKLELQQLVFRHVAKDQKSFARPGRPFGENETRGDPFHRELIEILRRNLCDEQQDRQQEPHVSIRVAERPRTHASSLSRVIGKSLMRRPVALKMALATAATEGTMVASPIDLAP